MNNNVSNGMYDIIAHAINQMKDELQDDFSLESINLAELSRRTGISRSKLRRAKKNGFVEVPHGNAGKKASQTVLSGYSLVLDNLLKSGIVNSEVCYKRLADIGYEGGISTIKNYIAEHRYLIPAKRKIEVPHSSRGRRFETKPGESYQMDWGFTDVSDMNNNLIRVSCFAMICHHCGMRYIEFFPNAKQENLFIGMIHAFEFMGIPEYILTDNMKSVVNKRDFEGKPIWNKDYAAFMSLLHFKTKLCKPYHPFTKGKVERLVRFVKENFLAGRTFYNVNDLNEQALEWCNEQNNVYHKALACVPSTVHLYTCIDNLKNVPPDDVDVMLYLAPARRISFDGFVNYEGRRFGVPYTYSGYVVRVMRDKDTIKIYSEDAKKLLVTHTVTWSKQDRYCKDQYAFAQPEEKATAPVKTVIHQLPEPPHSDIELSFEKFNFSNEEVDWND